MFLAILGAGADRDPIEDAANACGRNRHRRLRRLSRSAALHRGPGIVSLAGGDNPYAFRYAANDTANTLYYQADHASVVLASEPLDKDCAVWTPVPDNHILVVRAARAIELIPFPEREQIAAE